VKELGATAGTGRSGGKLTKEDVPQKDARAEEDAVMVVRPARARGFTFEQRSTHLRGTTTATMDLRVGAVDCATALKAALHLRPPTPYSTCLRATTPCTFR